MSNDQPITVILTRAFSARCCGQECRHVDSVLSIYERPEEEVDPLTTQPECNAVVCYRTQCPHYQRMVEDLEFAIGRPWRPGTDGPPMDTDLIRWASQNWRDMGDADWEGPRATPPKQEPVQLSRRRRQVTRRREE